MKTQKAFSLIAVFTAALAAPSCGLQPSEEPAAPAAEAPPQPTTRPVAPDNVAGKHFPMEMHMVHKSGDGALAVVGVFIEEGAHNAAFDPVWANLPKEKGVETHFQNVMVNVDDLLPESRTTYRYDGSLTTPPCSEGVKWLVMTTPIQLSTEQIGMFTALIEGNNRPVQPLNDRPVVTDRVRAES